MPCPFTFLTSQIGPIFPFLPFSPPFPPPRGQTPTPGPLNFPGARPNLAPLGPPFPGPPQNAPPKPPPTPAILLLGKEVKFGGTFAKKDPGFLPGAANGPILLTPPPKKLKGKIFLPRPI